ncbi:Uncharacterised protein [Streptococcus acidominimus]|uniref:Uncharacterized protein n=1 Tax=Streptococcus acidominimus TaxID=1326 RepID=A0A239XBN6_STRAI|nr:hypothetical protein [Streptococcus acidominimus]SNV44049.1 Uncharacterised protein [Streptococcus acidominimus]
MTEAGGYRVTVVVSDSDGRLRSESYQLTVLPKDLPEAPMVPVPLPEPDLPVVDDKRDDSAIEPIQETVISIIADQIDNNSNLDPDLSKKSDSIPNQEPVVTVDTANFDPVVIAITDSVRDDSGQSTVENDRNQEPMPVQIAVEALLDGFESLGTNTSVMPRLIAPSIDAFPQGIVIPFEWNQESGLNNDSQTASDDKMSTDQETDAETDDLTTDSVLTEKGATAGASKGFSKEQSVLVHLVTFGIVALYSILSYSFLKKKR